MGISTSFLIPESLSTIPLNILLFLIDPYRENRILEPIVPEVLELLEVPNVPIVPNENEFFLIESLSEKIDFSIY